MLEEHGIDKPMGDISPFGKSDQSSCSSRPDFLLYGIALRQYDALASPGRSCGSL